MDSCSDEEDNNKHDLVVGERNLARIRTQRLTNGYKEGVSAGQEETLQEGFDHGYKVALSLAFQMASMRGNLNAHLCQLMKSSGAETTPHAKLEDLVERLAQLENTLSKARNNSTFVAPVEKDKDSAVLGTEDSKCGAGGCKCGAANSQCGVGGCKCGAANKGSDSPESCGEACACNGTETESGKGVSEGTLGSTHVASEEASTTGVKDRTTDSPNDTVKDNVLKRVTQSEGFQSVQEQLRQLQSEYDSLSKLA